MRLSVVVPHYGTDELTRRLCEQLAPQLEAADAEVVVVDDCSPAPFAPEALPRTSVVRRERNGGFGSAANTGASTARGELLLVLNSDLEVSGTFLDDLLAAYAPHAPTVAAPAVVGPGGAASRTGRHWLTPLNQALLWIRPLGRLVRFEAYLDATGLDHRARPGRTVAVDWLSGAALLVPTGAFRDAGGFDERYYMYAEELDLQRRLSRDGLRRTYLGSVSVSHVGGASTDPSRARSWLVGSVRRYLTLWGGHRRWQVLVTGATLVNLVWDTGRRAAGQPVRPLDVAREDLDLVWSGRHLEDPRSPH